MIIYVKVKPGSLKNGIEECSDGTYLIYTKERALDGRANIIVIKMLAKKFNFLFVDIHIKNPKSRKKIIEIKV